MNRIASIAGSAALLAATGMAANAPPSMLTGRITDARTGLALANALVVVDGRDSVRTTADGRFSLAVSPDSNHTARLTYGDYLPLRLPGIGIQSASKRMNVEAELRSPEAFLTPKGSTRVPMVIRDRLDLLRVTYDSKSIEADSARIEAIEVVKMKRSQVLYDMAGSNGVICVWMWDSARGGPRSCIDG